MIYRSNLMCPDLAPFFKLKNPPLQTLGHDMPSDPDFLPGCGFLTHDEAAILYNIAKAWPKRWVDIGSRLGWSTAHIAVGEARFVVGVDPEYGQGAFLNRAVIQFPGEFAANATFRACTSEVWFKSSAGMGYSVDAVMIDGCHDTPEPTLDAIRAIDAGASVLAWHDFQGRPVRDAVAWVLNLKCECEECGGTASFCAHWKCRVYDTPNGMAVAWRDGCGFIPPDHVPDPAIDWAAIRRRYNDFDFTRCV